MMMTDSVFIIGLMTVVTLVWGILALPRCRQRLPSVYLIARSWWWMLAVLSVCYLIAKIKINSHYPYQWLLVGLFLLIGLRGSYEISRLWRLESKARLIRKLQARGLQANAVAIPYPKKFAIDHPNSLQNHDKNSSQHNYQHSPKKQPPNNAQAYAYLNALDIIFSLAFITLIISLIFLQILTWQRHEYGVLLFVLFASQFNDIAQYLCGKLFKGRWFKRGLAPRISPNKSIEGAVFGSLFAALLAALLGVWLTPFSWWLCLIMAYMLAVLGIAGDLLESAFKRQHGVKDTGTILAGHGGVLDRIDSLLLGVPLFTLLYLLIG